MLKNKRKNVFVLLLIIFMLSGIYIFNRVQAASSDYSLSNKAVVLDGQEDSEVEINFITAKSGSYYAIDAQWATKEVGTSYFTLTELEPNAKVDSSDVFNNNPNDGIVIYDDESLNGFSVNSGEELWTAKYKIDKDTPEGEYIIQINVSAVMSDNDESEEFVKSCVVSITRNEKVTIVPEISNYETNYEYTGSSIKPEIQVSDYITSNVLEKNTDYTISYGENTAVGTGTITIHPVSTSVYVFEETTVNFNINKKTLVSDNVTVPVSMTYTGNPLSPEPVVYANGKTLIKGTDYNVAYSNQNGQAGETIGVKVSGIGNYGGEVTKTVSIVPKLVRPVVGMENITLTYGDEREFNWTKSYEVTLSSSDESIVSVNHTFSNGVSSNVLQTNSSGNALITVTFAETEEYAETTTSFEVTVNKKRITISSAAVENKIFDGTTNAVVTNVSFGDSTLNFIMNTDYVVSAEFNDKNVGNNKSVEVIVALQDGNEDKYELVSSSIYCVANITALEIVSSDVSLENDTYTYSGSVVVPDIVIIKNGSTLISGTDYSVVCENNINVGNAIAYISGINNYSGEITKSFIINPKAINPTIQDIEPVTYNCEEQKPIIVVKDGTTNLVKDRDFEVLYTDNIDAGNGKIIVKSKEGSNYTFTDTTKLFTINPYDITESDISLEYTRVRYNGEFKEPSVEVVVNGHIIPSTDYSVEYSNNKEIGTAEVKITSLNSNLSTGTNGIVKSFEIVGKDVLGISGINDNQRITYTGNEVVLVGNLRISENTNNISVSDLVVTWYDEDGGIINRPSNVGKYSVSYDYSDNDYVGNLTINFEIIKARSGLPAEAERIFEALKGSTLSTITFSTSGLSWQNPETIITRGRKTYLASYIKNNDANNYLEEDISITVHGVESIVLDVTGYEAEYEYTGSSIKPNVVVGVFGTSTILTRNIDYIIEYGENKDVGIGTITIKPIASSDYTFTEVTNNFSIVRSNILESDVVVQNTILFQGTALSPDVRVYKNGVMLIEGLDYTISYSNQDGEIGTEVVVSVSGIGNYTGEIVKNVLITEKGPRNVAAISDTTLSFGDEKEYVSVENCEVTFSSNNPAVLTVTHSYAEQSSYNTIEAISPGEAIVTVTYPETNDYAETIQTFVVRVNKKSIAIVDVEIEDKTYDRTTDATINRITFDSDNSVLENGRDYTSTAAFENANAGKDKNVVVVVNLTDNLSDKYELASEVFNAKADIKVDSLIDEDVSIENNMYYFDGTEKRPEVIVRKDTILLTEDEDYVVTYRDNVDIGTAKVITRGIGNYSGEVTKTFEITEKNIIEISGIDNNQKIEYTGEEVVLEGQISVAPNSEGITANDLVIKWYDSSSDEIDKPINPGKYKVIYSYSSEESVGNLTVNFEITKASSGIPKEANELFTEVEGNILEKIKFETKGLSWKNANTQISRGKNRYIAEYTKNDDSRNYKTEEITIEVYGKALIRVNTSVDGNGGTISKVEERILEGEEIKIKVMPDDGYKIDKVSINGKETEVLNGEISIIAKTEDINVVAAFSKENEEVDTSDYKFLDGENQTYTIGRDDFAAFRVDADYTLFNDAYVDNNKVEKTNYTIKSGSTIITFTKSYLDNVSEGRHVLKMEYSNGRIAETNFYVVRGADSNKEASDSNDNSTNNDSNNSSGNTLTNTSSTNTSPSNSTDSGNNTNGVVANSNTSNGNTNGVSIASVGNRITEDTSVAYTKSTNTNTNTTVNSKESNSESGSPKTGTNIKMYVIMAISSFIGIVAMIIYRKKNYRSNIY